MVTVAADAKLSFHEIGGGGHDNAAVDFRLIAALVLWNALCATRRGPRSQVQSDQIHAYAAAAVVLLDAFEAPTHD